MVRRIPSTILEFCTTIMLSWVVAGEQLTGSSQLYFWRDTMTDLQILDKIAKGEISVAKGAKLIAASKSTTKAADNGFERRISQNKTGGLCVQDPAMLAWSTRKEKKYNYTLNMPVSAAKSLFGDAGFIKQIVSYLGTIESQYDDQGALIPTEDPDKLTTEQLHAALITPEELRALKEQLASVSS